MSYSAEVLADSPLAYWRLGDNTVTLTDSSGNGHNGTYTGGTSLKVSGFVSGDSDGAHTFASGSRGEVSDAAWMDATSFSVMATIKPSSVSGTQTVVARYSAAGFSSSSFTLRLDSNKLALYVFSGASFTAATQSTTLTAGTTYDVAATYDGTTGAMTVYVNGTSVATGTRTSMNNATAALTIGARPDASEPFGGTIDDVVYVGSVLTGTQVSNFATQRASGSGYATSVLATSPLAYYRLNDVSANAMADSGGSGRDGVYTGSPTLGVTGALTGDSNTAITLTTSQYATTTYGSWQDATTAVTVEAWVKHSGTGYREIITKDDSGGGSTQSQWRLRISSANQAEFLVWHSGLTTVTGATTLTAGTWYHVVGVYDSVSGVQSVYVNGVSDGSTSSLSGSVTTGTIPIVVGRLNGGTEPFSGSLDELAFYNTALSSTRIAAHYTAGTSSPSNIAAPAATATAAAVVPVVSAGSGVTAVAATASSAAVVPVVSGGSTVAGVAATASAAGVAPTVTADAAVVAPAATATSTALAPSVSGSSAVTVTVPAATATAAALAPSLAWDANLSAVTATATADALVPTLSVGATIAAVPATASADAIAPTVAASNPDATVLAVPATATAAAVAPIIYAVIGTDTSNAFTGRQRGGLGLVTQTAPVASPPASQTVKYDKAVAYPTPVMVNGRPT